jgi:hypothetical protein
MVTSVTDTSLGSEQRLLALEIYFSLPGHALRRHSLIMRGEAPDSILSNLR